MKLMLWVCVVCKLVGIVVSDPVGGYPDSLQNLQYGYGGGGSGGSSYGSGSGSSKYGDEPANYDFQYEVFGGGNFFGHQESRRDQKTNGKYHVLLPDGRRQIVTYIADESGYHPIVSYEGDVTQFDKVSGGYEDAKKPLGGYGSPLAPVSENSLGTGKYSSRIKRQFLAPETTDYIKIYKSEENPEQTFRNRRRRNSKRGYLVIYPNSFSKTTFHGDSTERTS